MPTPPPLARTRLAPSPTGALHLGNARTFLVNWALARRRGWRVVLRIEDLDGPRVKPQAARGILSTLEWLGIDWDEGPIVQSADLEPYRHAMRKLAAHARVFVSNLSRGEIEAAASAPQEGSGEVPFPPSLRPPLAPLDFDRLDARESNWRFALPAGSNVVEFVDQFAGAQRLDVASSIGDFIVWTRRRQPAYQLAVVVDDHRQGITHIVRGDDLLHSAARQLLLYRALGYRPEPIYFHLPLVVGTDGKRLAKRHGDTRVDSYRALGVPAEAVIGLVAHWCGVTPEPRPLAAAEFKHLLDLTTITPHPVVFTPEHDAWLRRHAP
ncbi:MAG: glutamate--tRNA ligase family protein [Phycisphaerales bacterium]